MSYQMIESGSQLRLCFLGCGQITSRHAKVSGKCDKNIKLSFASRSLEKSESYRKKHQGINAYPSYEEAIHSELEDVIMINTPPHLHFELAKKSLEAGKHVIVEKPPFFQSSDFDILGEIADQKGLQFMVAENYYYKPLRTKIKSIIDDNLIGDALFILINATKTQKTTGDWREDKSVAKYGALFEGGIHWINFINNIGLDIISISGFKPRKDDEMERSIQVTATTRQGAVINLLYSWEVDTIMKGIRGSRIYGSKGSVFFETNGIFVWLRGIKKQFSFPGLRHITGQQKMLEDFFSAIRSGNPPQFTWQMAKQDLVLIEKIYSSVEESKNYSL